MPKAWHHVRGMAPYFAVNGAAFVAVNFYLGDESLQALCGFGLCYWVSLLSVAVFGGYCTRGFRWANKTLVKKFEWR